LAQQHSNAAFQNAMFQQMDTLAAQQLAIIPNAQPPLPPLPPLPAQLQPPAQPNIALPALPSPLVLDVELPDWDLDHDNCIGMSMTKDTHHREDVKGLHLKLGRGAMGLHGGYGKCGSGGVIGAAFMLQYCISSHKEIQLLNRSIWLMSST
jgi:hypothetical protein